MRTVLHRSLYAVLYCTVLHMAMHCERYAALPLGEGYLGGGLAYTTSPSPLLNCLNRLVPPLLCHLSPPPSTGLAVPMALPLSLCFPLSSSPCFSFFSPASGQRSLRLTPFPLDSAVGEIVRLLVLQLVLLLELVLQQQLVLLLQLVVQ